MVSKHLQRELDQLRDQLVSQFGVVEQMIQLAVRALVERRTDLADRVIESDEDVDHNDVRIEEECLKLLALHQPMAADMRWLITVIKVNGELERIADLACNISERTKALDLFPLFRVPDELNEMVTVVAKMVGSAIDSFVKGDVVLARETIRADDLVDTFNRVVIDDLHHTMKNDPEQIEPGVHCFSASRHLERIGDLAENIAEEVIYLVEGDIVRHQHGLRVDQPQSS